MPWRITCVAKYYDLEALETREKILLSRLTKMESRIQTEQRMPKIGQQQHSDTAIKNMGERIQ
jgi:hypothetical protein